MIILGVVGNPASGKSTVCDLLHQRGATWINADVIAKEILQSPEVRDSLCQRFGPAIRNPSGDGEPIIRAELARIVFGDDAASRQALTDLESILHPKTRSRIREQLLAAADADAWLAVLDVPLLFESDWDLACDSIWCVDAPRPSQAAWARSRGWSEGEVARREANQLPIAEKRGRSNLTIHNDGSLKDLSTAVDRLVTAFGYPNS